MQGSKAYLSTATAKELASNAEAKADVIVFQLFVTGMAAQYPDIDAFRIGTIDGWYGPKCAAACTTLQALTGFEPPARHLTVDGECGAKTWARLLNFD